LTFLPSLGPVAASRAFSPHDFVIHVRFSSNTVWVASSGDLLGTRYKTVGIAKQLGIQIRWSRNKIDSWLSILIPPDERRAVVRVPLRLFFIR
jgi:hypothetical protein